MLAWKPYNHLRYLMVQLINISAYSMYIMNSPISDKHRPSVSETNPKRKILRSLRDDCLIKVKQYRKKYKKLKRIDDAIDGGCALLTGISISFTVSGIGFPPLLIASACTSGFEFVVSRVQDKYNLKARYTQHNLSINQYSNLAREILTVLTKNNLSNEEYQSYICEITDKISLIEDSSMII